MIYDTLVFFYKINLALIIFSFKLYPAHSTQDTLFPLRNFYSPLSAKFWRFCVLDGGTQRRALPQ